MTVIEEMQAEQTTLKKETFDFKDDVMKSLLAKGDKEIESKFRVSKYAPDERNPKNNKIIGGRRR